MDGPVKENSVGGGRKTVSLCCLGYAELSNEQKMLSQPNAMLAHRFAAGTARQ